MSSYVIRTLIKTDTANIFTKGKSALDRMEKCRKRNEIVIRTRRFTSRDISPKSILVNRVFAIPSA